MDVAVDGGDGERERWREDGRQATIDQWGTGMAGAVEESREDHAAMHISRTTNSEHDSIIQLTMDSWTREDEWNGRRNGDPEIFPMNNNAAMSEWLHNEEMGGEWQIGREIDNSISRDSRGVEEIICNVGLAIE